RKRFQTKVMEIIPCKALTIGSRRYLTLSRKTIFLLFFQTSSEKKPISPRKNLRMSLQITLRPRRRMLAIHVILCIISTRLVMASVSICILWIFAFYNTNSVVLKTFPILLHYLSLGFKRAQ